MVVPNTRTRINSEARRLGRNAHACAPAVEALRGACGPGVRMRPQRGQRLGLEDHGPRTFWMIESGCLLLQQPLANDERQVLLVLLAGEMLDAAWTSAIPGLELVAAAPSQVIRAQSPASADKMKAPAAAATFEEARGDLARYTLSSMIQHAACLGRFTGSEKVAAFLLALARRSAVSTPRPIVPLSRRDLADCLGLNADTVSRIIADLRRQRVLSRASRNELVITNLDALSRLSPLDSG